MSDGDRVAVGRVGKPHGLAGAFFVEEEGGRPLGRVTDVAPGIANDVLELDSGISLPMVEDCVLRVDRDRQKILIAPGYADPG